VKEIIHTIPKPSEECSDEASGESCDYSVDRHCVLAGVVFAPVQAQERSSNGLEVDDYKQVEVLVEDLHQDAKDIGLTRQRIYNKTALTLRKYGLIPTYGNDLPPIAKRPEYLYIQVSVSGKGISISVQFLRPVIFLTHQTGRAFRHVGITWLTGSTGTHGGNYTYMLDIVEGQVEEFVLAYLEANQQ